MNIIDGRGDGILKMNNMQYIHGMETVQTHRHQRIERNISAEYHIMKEMPTETFIARVKQILSTGQNNENTVKQSIAFAVPTVHELFWDH